MSPICFVVIFVQTLLLPVTDLKEKRPVASYGRPFLSLLGFSYPHTAYRLTTVSILRYATTMLLKIRMLSFAYYLWIILFRYCFDCKFTLFLSIYKLFVDKNCNFDYFLSLFALFHPSFRPYTLLYILSSPKKVENRIFLSLQLIENQK